MPEITSSYVDSLAPNAAAVKNGQGLVKKNSFVRLNQSEDGTLIFGECSGSGKSNYVCSVDFILPDKPVSRCSCPSRQFPCKHALGLMYAYAEGRAFSLAPVPEDIIDKREKAEKREAAKANPEAETVEAKPKKVNASALKKKIAAQLEGLELLEKLILSLIRSGLGTIDKKTLKDLQDHVKQMGNYYLTGAQTELRRLSLLLAEDADREQNYTYAMEQLNRLHAFIKKSRTYLTAKQADPGLAPDQDSILEEWLGHAWQLSELKELGRITENVELLQLSFYSYDDKARQEFVDVGCWMKLNGGEILRTLQYRPYKAVKHLREEDSFFEVAQIPALYTYPGDLNPRVRFESAMSRPLLSADVDRLSAYAHRSYTEAVKKVKNQLKNPLSDKTPLLLLHAAAMGKNTQGQVVITDETGQRLVLKDIPSLPQGTVSLLPYLSSSLQQDSLLLVMFEHDLEEGRLVAQPMTIIKDSAVTRLLY